jgi:hypothetical protein
VEAAAAVVLHTLFGSRRQRRSNKPPRRFLRCEAGSGRRRRRLQLRAAAAGGRARGGACRTIHHREGGAYVAGDGLWRHGRLSAAYAACGGGRYEANGRGEKAAEADILRRPRRRRRQVSFLFSFPPSDKPKSAFFGYLGVFFHVILSEEEKS